jgi:hypothetical protein
VARAQRISVTTLLLGTIAILIEDADEPVSQSADPFIAKARASSLDIAPCS